jgi:peptidoglycan/LPS O-acetylase OafA/YrhL
MKQNNFDFLRFYFAFVVVIGHLIIISGVETFKIFAPFFNTYTSVTAFFCISGFLIAQSYLNSKSLKSYFQKRAARLLPAYIFVIVLSVLILSAFSKYSLNDYFTHPQLFKYLAANLSFMNFVQPCLPGVFTENGLTCDVNGALWTLKVEVSFYITIPFILFLSKKIKRKYILFIIIYIFSVLYRNLLMYYSSVSGNSLFGTLAHQLPGFLSYFVCGIGLYYYFDSFLKYKKWIFIISLCFYLFEIKMDWEIFTPLALSIIVFYIAFSLKRLNSFGKYGDISYGIYIFHCPIIKVVTDLGTFSKFNPYLVALILIATILTVGFASWHLIEKGFLKRTHSIRIN